MAEDAPSDGFVYAFGSGMALHREGGQMWLQLAGEKRRHELTIAQAERIRDDFDRTIQAVKRARAAQVQVASDGRGGETSGDG